MSVTTAAPAPLSRRFSVAPMMDRHACYLWRTERLLHRTVRRALVLGYDGFSEVDGLGVEIDFFDFCVRTHHEVLAPERNREHSIGDQVGDIKCGVYGALTFLQDRVGGGF